MVIRAGARVSLAVVVGKIGLYSGLKTKDLLALVSNGVHWQDFVL